jgi:hypothetical protein
MRKRLHKTDRLTIRLTPAQARDIDQAARLESDRRGEVVDPSTLVRELVVKAVSRILASQPTADSAA